MAETSSDIGLSSALEALRQELAEAWTTSAQNGVRLRVADVTLTLQVVARRETEGGGKLRWWVLEAGAQRTSGSETTQTLTLKLSPTMENKAVDPSPSSDA